MLLPLLSSGCAYQNYQSTFGNAGDGTRHFNTLFTVFLVICSIMYLAVILFMVSGIVRARRPGPANVVEEGRHHETDPVMRTGLIAWAIVIGTGLIALAIASFFTDRSDAKVAGQQKLAVTVTGNQWWWDITYTAADASKTVHTANELHLPVGVPVRIFLNANDVIHSFWVPALAGKQDLIPGRQNDITLVPRKIGIFRGQCAEFCGLEHAKMGLVVDVESYGDFIKWWEHQLKTAPQPTNALTLAGFKYVTSGPCSSCHAIAGTPASGTIGPDLTHLASRRTLAAAMPMSEGNLYGWVEDPQSLKPGAAMPTIGLEPQQLRSVVAYLETLK
ncbi:MAG TPA: cytochrome c oxidase subunit II [Chloroflexota bacterium]|nr:cytochrome c oxidase subunit II [Chloroflexota bacterium]